MTSSDMDVHDGGEEPRSAQSPSQVVVAMLLNRELTQEEADEVSAAMKEGLTDLFDIASRVEPGRVFYPWERVLLGAMFNPVLSYTGSSTEGA